MTAKTQSPPAVSCNATPGFRLPARFLSARPLVAVPDVAHAGFLKLRRIWR